MKSCAPWLCVLLQGDCTAKSGYYPKTWRRVPLVRWPTRATLHQKWLQSLAEPAKMPGSTECAYTNASLRIRLQPWPTFVEFVPIATRAVCCTVSAVCNMLWAACCVQVQTGTVKCDETRRCGLPAVQRRARLAPLPRQMEDWVSTVA